MLIQFGNNWMKKKSVGIQNWTRLLAEFILALHVTIFLYDQISGFQAPVPPSVRSWFSDSIFTTRMCPRKSNGFLLVTVRCLSLCSWYFNVTYSVIHCCVNLSIGA